MGHDAVVLHRDDDVADGAGLLRLALDLGEQLLSHHARGDVLVAIEAVLIAGILAGVDHDQRDALDGAHRVGEASYAVRPINGVLLPVLLVFLVFIAQDKHIMGKHRNGRAWNVLTWGTIALITVLTVVMFGLQALGY